MSEISVTVNKKDRTMTITLPLQKPTVSASGKTMVVATTRGNQKVDCEYDGQQLTVGVNVYYSNKPR